MKKKLRRSYATGRPTARKLWNAFAINFLLTSSHRRYLPPTVCRVAATNSTQLRTTQPDRRMDPAATNGNSNVMSFHWPVQVGAISSSSRVSPVGGGAKRSTRTDADLAVSDSASKPVKWLMDGWAERFASGVCKTACVAAFFTHPSVCDPVLISPKGVRRRGLTGLKPPTPKFPDKNYLLIQFQIRSILCFAVCTKKSVSQSFYNNRSYRLRCWTAEAGPGHKMRRDEYHLQWQRWCVTPSPPTRLSNAAAQCIALYK